MKKLVVAMLAIIISGSLANAQDAVKNSKVILKNGTTVVGTVQKQGNEVIVTDTFGDVFYFSESEISKIQDEDNGTAKKSKKSGKSGKAAAPKDSGKSAAKSEIDEYKRDIKYIYKQSHTQGKDIIDSFWGENGKARFYYEKSVRAKRTAAAMGILGPCLIGAGHINIVRSFDMGYYEETVYYHPGEEYESRSRDWIPDPNSFNVFLSGTIVAALGGAMLLSSFFIPISARKNLKYSYSYHDSYGKNRSMNVSAAPTFYAHNGAGVGMGISITF